MSIESKLYTIFFQWNTEKIGCIYLEAIIEGQNQVINSIKSADSLILNPIFTSRLDIREWLEQSDHIS